MDNRRLISYILFALGVLVILAALLLNIASIQGLRGALLGIAIIVIGIIFFRRAGR
jgi:hypothetical protein